MRKTCISKDWLLKAPGTNGRYIPVDLPNDYTISLPRSADVPGGASNGFFPGGDGHYVKYLTPGDEKRHMILDLDGAYMCAEVMYNEDILIMHPHGYAPVLVDLTDKTRFGHTNKLAISTKGLQPSTRWYSGAGIYRDVFLWTGGEVRVEPRDLFITTPEVTDEKAAVKAAYAIAADRAASVTVKATVIAPDGQVAAQAQGALSALAGEKTPLELTLSVDHPQLWDVDSPAL